MTHMTQVLKELGTDYICSFWMCEWMCPRIWTFDPCSSLVLITQPGKFHVHPSVKVLQLSTVYEEMNFYCRNPGCPQLYSSTLIAASQSSHWLAARLGLSGGGASTWILVKVMYVTAVFQHAEWLSSQHWFLIGSDMLTAALFVFVVAPVE